MRKSLQVPNYVKQNRVGSYEIRTFSVPSFLNLLEVPLRTNQIAREKLASRDAFQSRNLGEKSYLRLCKLFGVKPMKPKSTADPEKLRLLIKMFSTRVSKMKSQLKTLDK